MAAVHTVWGRWFLFSGETLSTKVTRVCLSIPPPSLTRLEKTRIEIKTENKSLICFKKAKKKRDGVEMKINDPVKDPIVGLNPFLNVMNTWTGFLIDCSTKKLPSWIQFFKWRKPKKLKLKREIVAHSIHRVINVFSWSLSAGTVSYYKNNHGVYAQCPSISLPFWFEDKTTAVL